MLHTGDSIVALHTDVLPIIDGEGSDIAWTEASWIDLNYTWIPYNVTLPKAECSGRYKVTWNKTTNLLYFLVEITDEFFVNGYVFSPSDGSYPNYDVVEVFIDEDRPGSYHAKNNAAFAYHITGGNANTDHDVVDIYDATPGDGWDWDNNKVNCNSHFPAFKRTNVGHDYVWEFSMMVIDSTYTPTDDPTLFQKALVEGKEMGLTVAYCDSDIPGSSPYRENFLASKYQTLANSNTSWENSSTFAHLTLKNDILSRVGKIGDSSTKVWMDGGNKLQCKIKNLGENPRIQLFDMLGRIALEATLDNDKIVDLSGLSSGYYLVNIQNGLSTISRKIFVK